MKDELAEAVEKDLGRNQFMNWLMEIGLNIATIRHTIKNLKNWMKVPGQKISRQVKTLLAAIQTHRLSPERPCSIKAFLIEKSLSKRPDESLTQEDYKLEYSDMKVK